jgi:DNA-binding GntR family transcriptional regulator
MAILSKTIKQESTRDKVYSAIREAIFSGRLETGQRLPEVGLAQELRVSRAIVREALQQLDHEGLVEQIAYKGTRVVDLSARQLEEIIALRLLLETEAVRQAKERLSLKDKLEFRDILKELRKAVNDPKRHAELDLALHQKIWELTGNELLVRTLTRITAPLMAVGAILRSSEVFKSSRERRPPADHGDVIEKLCDGTTAEAVEAMRIHVSQRWWLSQEDVGELVQVKRRSKSGAKKGLSISA